MAWRDYTGHRCYFFFRELRLVFVVFFVVFALVVFFFVVFLLVLVFFAEAVGLGFLAIVTRRLPTSTHLRNRAWVSGPWPARI